MMIRQLFPVKNVCITVKKKLTCLVWMYGLLGPNYRVPKLSKFHPTVSGIIILRNNLKA